MLTKDAMSCFFFWAVLKDQFHSTTFTNTLQFVEIDSQGRQEQTHCTQSSLWLLMIRRHKEPGYQHAWCCLAPGRPGCHFKTEIFNLVLLIGIFTSSMDNALRWMPWDVTEGKSTLIQVMAWCRQATSHYLSQCWPGSMWPYNVTRPQWVNQRA